MSTKTPVSPSLVSFHIKSERMGDMFPVKLEPITDHGSIYVKTTVKDEFAFKAEIQTPLNIAAKTEVTRFDAVGEQLHSIGLAGDSKQERLDPCPDIKPEQTEDDEILSKTPFPVAIYQVCSDTRKDTVTTIPISCVYNITESRIPEKTQADTQADKQSCSYSTKENGIPAHGNKTSGKGHVVGKPYTCPSCPWYTSLSGRINEHMRKINHTNTDEKPYKCSFCSYKTSSASNIKTHRRIHTGEKPYKCSICIYSTGFASNLKRHERTHTCAKPSNMSIWYLTSESDMLTTTSEHISMRNHTNAHSAHIAPHKQQTSANTKELTLARNTSKCSQ